MTEKQIFKTTWGGRPLEVEIDQLTGQANGTVLVRYGGTVVLSAAVTSKKAKDVDFFPLTVDYEERVYTVGKIPGNFIKREGRPSECAALTTRLVDRPIHPMFLEGFRNKVQITNIIMSVEQGCTPGMTAVFGSSLALAVSDIPFDGLIADVDVGRINGEYILNPTVEQAERTDIKLTVAGTKEAINMVKSGAKEVSEENMLSALPFSFDAIKELVVFQGEIVAAVGKPKMDVDLLQVDADLKEEIFNAYYSTMKTAVMTGEKLAHEVKIDKVKDTVKEVYAEKFSEHEEEVQLLKKVKQITEDLEEGVIRESITIDKIRPDSRKLDETRHLSSGVGTLPRVHSSGLFTRDQTQALSVCTLAPLEEYQIIDGLDVQGSKHFVHHCSFLQFSVGSTGRVGSPGRREIGHNALDERALAQIIPSEGDFPYTIRLVAGVLESNSSSLQASICAGTLALMDAGAPIKAPVTDIAMGLVSDGESYAILTDIQSLENHLGDMNFRVAGAKDGITALQMNIKIQEITEQILTETLDQAKKARMEILEELATTVAAPRKELSQCIPRIEMIQTKPAKIKDIIGKGGEIADGIIDGTGVKIDIDQDNNVSIAPSDAEVIKKAIRIIEELTKEVEVDRVYLAKVVRIEKFGALVNLIKGKGGLIHTSQLASECVSSVEDVVKLGGEVLVKVTGIDKQDRINVSRRALLNKENKEK